jgi:LysR family glycine cleavage system transcriptional activator
MPLAGLEAFVLIARLGNLSRAAERMNLTVSALSHQMRGLEERIGQTLFLRGSRGVSLTAEGERLLSGIEGPLQAIERSLQRSVAADGHALSVSLMPSVASSWLVPRLPDFVARHPDVQINLDSSTRLVTFAEDGVDVAMRFGAGQWPGLRAEHLFDEWLTPVASPTLLRRLGAGAARNLARCPLLGDPGQRWPAWFAAFGGSAPARYTASFSDSETLHRAAVEGLGVALGRMTMARPLIEAGRLKTLTSQRLRAEYSHYLVTPPGSVNKPAVQWFSAWLREQAREYAQQQAARPRPRAPRKAGVKGSAKK